MGRAVVGADLFREQASHAELPRGLEGEDDPTGRGTGHEIDHRRAIVIADTRRPIPAEFAGGRRVGEHGELLDVRVAVPPALQLEMALTEGA